MFKTKWINLKDLKMICCMAFTFVTAAHAFLVDKSCRQPTVLLIYALDLTLNDYFLFY